MKTETITQAFSKSSFDWCFSTLGCPEYDLDQALDLADRYGIKYIEVRCLLGIVDICGYLETYLSDYTDKVAGIKPQHKIIIWNTSFTVTNNSADDRKLLIRIATAADQLGCRYLRIFGGFHFKDKLTPELLQQAVDTLNWFDQIRRENNLSCELILEVHDGFSSTDRCLQLINAAGRDVNILWDAHHSYCYAGESFEYSWNKLHKYIKHVHVKDSVKTVSGEVVAQLPGQGTLPIKELFKLLSGHNFNGPVSLEWEKHWEQQLPALETALDAIVDAGWLE